MIETIIMPFKCIVIDDEPDAVEILSDYILEIPELVLVQSYTDPLKAMNEISKGDGVDIIFMDVDMPLISGIDLSKAVREKTEKLIFTTAHTRYAFDAFEVEADAYLLKPFSLAKFALTMNKVLKGQATSSLSNEMKTQKDFYVKTIHERNRLVRIRFDDVIAVEGEKNYVKIYTTQGEIISYLTLKEIRERFDEIEDFIQVHRSFLVSKNYIDKVEGNLIKLPGNMTVPIGAFYKDYLYAYIADNTIKTARKN